MTSMIMDQLTQDESPPTGPAHTLGDPTVSANRDNFREGSNLTGNSRETTEPNGSFTRYLAKLAKLMFIQQGPYRDTEEGDPIDPDTLGEPPGDILATLGNLTPPMAAHGNLTRSFLMAFQDQHVEGPPGATTNLPRRITTYHIFTTHFPYLAVSASSPPFTAILSPQIFHLIIYHLYHLFFTSLHHISTPSYFPFLSPHLSQRLVYLHLPYSATTPLKLDHLFKIFSQRLHISIRLHNFSHHIIIPTAPFFI